MPPPAESFAVRLLAGPALRAQPDPRLVALVRGGYEHAFEEIVRRYGHLLTRYAAAIVGGRAEDVTQDAFSKALLAMRRDGREIDLRPWLFRIVRNTALNDLRDRPPSAAALAEAISGGEDPSEELARREELADLMQRLRALPEPQRAAIVMREMEGLGHEEIAKALGLSGGAARQAIYRARRALRDGLGMLVPLPLLRALLSGTPTAPVEAGAGAVVATGAGVALKAATATVLVAGAVGAGVAIHHGRHGEATAEAKSERSSIAATGRREEASPEALRPGEPGSGARSGDAQRNGRPTGNAGGGDGSDGGSVGGSPARHGSGESGPRGGDGPRAGPTETGSHGGPRDDGGREQGGHRSDDSGTGGSPGSGEGAGGDDGSGSGDSSGSPEEKADSTSGGDSGSNNGPGSGGDGGEKSSGSDESGDSHDGDGFSTQTEPQTQEEP